MEYTKDTVAVALRVKDNLWMSQRINTTNFHGLWQFPGGKVEDKENPLDAGKREVQEETGLNLDINRFRYLGSILGDPSTKYCYVYFVDLGETEYPMRTENKNTDWVSMSYYDALKLNLMPGLTEMIQKIRTVK